MILYLSIFLSLTCLLLTVFIWIGIEVRDQEGNVVESTFVKVLKTAAQLFVWGTFTVCVFYISEHI